MRWFAAQLCEVKHLTGPLSVGDLLALTIQLVTDISISADERAAGLTETVRPTRQRHGAAARLIAEARYPEGLLQPLTVLSGSVLECLAVQWAHWLRLVRRRCNATSVCRSRSNVFQGSRMKRSLIWCLFGSMFVVSAVWSQANSAGGTEQAIAALEQQWLKSQQTNNPDLLAPLLADKFVGTSSEGKVTTTKAEALAEAKSEKWTSADYIDVKVAVYGDAAIATGGFKGKGTDASGKPVDATDRFTDTWVKMPNGKWQCVASQDTAVKK
jgi:ketosteroid isomerase-like protein